MYLPLFSALAVSLQVSVQAQRVETGFLDRSVSVAGQAYKYQVYAFAALAQTMKDYHTDPARVYLTGLSMGGHGTWYVAYRHPELFAAIAPLCGWVGEWDRFRGSVPVVPAESGAALPALARRLGKLPIWILHGEVDGAVPVVSSREPAAALKAAGANVQYTEFLGMNHNIWDAVYGSDEFVRWLFAQHR